MEEEGARLRCSAGGVAPRRRVRRRGEAARGRGEERPSSEGEAEAAYQAVSCGDKQSPEVIRVHAACLLLLEDAGTAEETRPREGKRGRPMCTAGRQDSGGSRGDRGGPGRPGKGEGVQRDTGQGGGKRASEMAHTWRGVGWREGGDREKEREREEQLMPQSAGAQGGAYLPVILHVVAQADEAGLELLRPQRPAVVLPGVRRQVRARGGAETRPARRRGERGRGHMQRGRGWGTHRGGNRVRGDTDKVMARDGEQGKGHGGLEGGQRPAQRLGQSRAGISPRLQDLG